jgi:predicted phosphate transport protein (TIGR00153 family)
MVRIIPRDAKFFDMFNEMAENLTDGARLLLQLLKDYKGQDIYAGVQQIKGFEHRGDDMTHAVLRKLNQTFITPFDREDIHRLASSIDDVLDFVNAAAERMVLYKIENPPEAAARLATIIVRQSEELTSAVNLLEKTQGVLEHCVEINRLEDEADQICRAAIAALFEHERDPITLIKYKELFEVLEMATDKAEDAANVLEAVVLKSA